MRTAALFVLLCCSVSCAGSLPAAGSALATAKTSFTEADRLYTAVCYPPLDPRLAGPCRELAHALDATEIGLGAAVQAYSAVNEIAKGK